MMMPMEYWARVRPNSKKIDVSDGRVVKDKRKKNTSSAKKTEFVRTEKRNKWYRTN